MDDSPEARKLERVRYLLDHWDDIFDGAAAASDSSASGERLGISLLPRMANHPSVKELSRCLALLASASPGDYRHLKSYRCGAEWRNVDTWRRMKLPSGKYDWEPDRIRERIVPRWIRPQRVAAGEAFIVRVFQGEVFIPDELWGAFVPAKV
jgi:hypothetical protein